MTTSLRRTGACVAFCWDGKIPDPLDPKFAAALEAQRFRSIDEATDEGESCGWVSPDDPSGAVFAPEEVAAGTYGWARIRTDRKRLPGAWLRNQMADAERSRARALAPRERRDLKRDLVAEVLPGLLPATSSVDVLVAPLARRVLLGTAGKAGVENFEDLWFNTFGVQLCRLDAMGWAREVTPEAGRAAIEAVQPQVWRQPKKGQQRIAIDTTGGFLGEEFLLWLWHHCEQGTAEWPGLDGHLVGVMIDDLLVFGAPVEDGTELTLRGGLPIRTPEARAALRSGHRVSRARLVVATGEQEWTVTVDGATLACIGVKLPEDCDDVDAPEDRVAGRAHAWVALHALLGDLYGKFVALRIGDAWQEEAAAIAAWMRA